MGDGVSKTSIKYLDPYKKTLQKEHESQVILQAEVENLKKQLEVESKDLRVRWTRRLHPCLKQIHKCGLLPNAEAPLRGAKVLRVLMHTWTKQPQTQEAHLRVSCST